MLPLLQLYFLPLAEDIDSGDVAVTAIEALGIYLELEPEAWQALTTLLFRSVKPQVRKVNQVTSIPQWPWLGLRSASALWCWSRSWSRSEAGKRWYSWSRAGSRF